MKRKNNTMERPIPLKHIDQVRDSIKGYGDVYSVMDRCRTKFLESGISWDDRCYLPLTCVVEFHKNIRSLKQIPDSEGYVQLLFHTYQWRQHKQIYSFDSTFAEELVQSDSSEVDTAVFENLPYNSLYVEIKDGLHAELGNHIVGFYCSYNTQAYANGDPAWESGFANCLHIVFVSSNGAVVGCPIALAKGITVRDSLNMYLHEYVKAMEADHSSKDEDGSYFNALKDVLPTLLNAAVNLLLYICSVNNDVQENPEQKKIYKAPSACSISKDKLSEVRKWDVGYRIGRIIRDSKNESDPKPHGTHTNSSTKRPHSRRGHFHHYWVGKRESEERKLIVKWVAPMFINAKITEEMPAVITKIES